MKHRILVLIALSLFALALGKIHAQSIRHTDQPFYDSSYSDRLVEVDAHALVGLSTVLQNYASVVPGMSDHMMSPGCAFGGGVGVRFAIRKSFGIGTGLDFRTNNFGYAMSIVYSDPSTISSIYNKNHYYEVQVPVCLSWRFNIGYRMKWNVDAGVYLCRGIGGTMKTSGYTSGENALGQPIVSSASHSTNYYESDQPLINGVSRFDWGPRVASGLVYREHYILDAILQVGAPNLSIQRGSIDTRYHNFSLLFSLGYIF